jgi:hypothetical protein
MKKIVALALACAAVVTAHAQVTSTGFFGTNPNWREDFDWLPSATAWSSFNVFFGGGTVNRIGTLGALQVGPPAHIVPWNSPNAMYGRSVDVEITVSTPMKRFGGYFKLAPSGITVNQATFVFYDASNNLIGVGVSPVTWGWNWIGWKTVPSWSRVEIYGNGSLPGYIAMDELRVKP